MRGSWGHDGKGVSQAEKPRQAQDPDRRTSVLMACVLSVCDGTSRNERSKVLAGH